MENGSSGYRLDPAIRDRILEAFKNLTDALDEPATSHAATANLREASDRAMRAVARLTIELHAN